MMNLTKYKLVFVLLLIFGCGCGSKEKTPQWIDQQKENKLPGSPGGPNPGSGDPSKNSGPVHQQINIRPGSAPDSLPHTPIVKPISGKTQPVGAISSQNRGGTSSPSENSPISIIYVDPGFRPSLDRTPSRSSPAAQPPILRFVYRDPQNALPDESLSPIEMQAAPIQNSFQIKVGKAIQLAAIFGRAARLAIQDVHFSKKWPFISMENRELPLASKKHQALPQDGNPIVPAALNLDREDPIIPHDLLSEIKPPRGPIEKCSRQAINSVTNALKQLVEVGVNWMANKKCTLLSEVGYEKFSLDADSWQAQFLEFEEPLRDLTGRFENYICYFPIEESEEKIFFDLGANVDYLNRLYQILIPLGVATQIDQVDQIMIDFHKLVEEIDSPKVPMGNSNAYDPSSD